MPEIQEESTTGLADAPNAQDEAYHDASAEDRDEMLSSLSLDDLPDEVPDGEPEPEPAQLYLVVAPFGGFASVKQMATLDDLRAELIALEGDDVQVFVFSGVRYNVTKGPYRHLIPATGEPIELFDLPEPEALEIDDQGYLGPPASLLEIPPPLPEELEGEGADDWGDGPPNLDDEPPP
jgi:hypothetical protein